MHGPQKENVLDLQMPFLITFLVLGLDCSAISAAKVCIFNFIPFHHVHLHLFKKSSKLPFKSVYSVLLLKKQVIIYII